MQDNWLAEMTARYADAYASLHRLQMRTFEHLAAVVDFNLGMARSYASLGFEQARALYQVQDPRTWADYLRSQSRFAHRLEDRVSRDLDALGSMNREFANDVQEATRSNVIPFTAPPHLKNKTHSA